MDTSHSGLVRPPAKGMGCESPREFESHSIRHGRLAEWVKAPVLKTDVSRGTVGSNPTPSSMERSDSGLFRCAGNAV